MGTTAAFILKRADGIWSFAPAELGPTSAELVEAAAVRSEAVVAGRVDDSDSGSLSGRAGETVFEVVVGERLDAHADDLAAWCRAAGTRFDEAALARAASDDSPFAEVRLADVLAAVGLAPELVDWNLAAAGVAREGGDAALDEVVREARLRAPDRAHAFVSRSRPPGAPTHHGVLILDPEGRIASRFERAETRPLVGALFSEIQEGLKRVGLGRLEVMLVSDFDEASLAAKVREVIAGRSSG
jgi:hypothetical protein